VEEVGLEINTQKTEAMKFRHSGRLAQERLTRLQGQELKFVNKFVYLGITLTPSAKTFSAHIGERTRKALIASTTLKNVQMLSLKTALALFGMKIGPTASYGIQLVWKNLSCSQLTLLDRFNAGLS
jgi:hypothetical protein